MQQALSYITDTKLIIKNAPSDEHSLLEQLQNFSVKELQEEIQQLQQEIKDAMYIEEGLKSLAFDQEKYPDEILGIIDDLYNLLIQKLPDVIYETYKSDDPVFNSIKNRDK